MAAALTKVEPCSTAAKVVGGCVDDRRSSTAAAPTEYESHSIRFVVNTALMFLFFLCFNRCGSSGKKQNKTEKVVKAACSFFCDMDVFSCAAVQGGALNCDV